LAERWDSHPHRVLKTKNLTDFGFLTIREIRSKAEVRHVLSTRLISVTVSASERLRLAALDW
jgi:hypothetical protein